MCLHFYSFDQGGHYLFTGASDSHIYLLDAKPSKQFSVIGYTGKYTLKIKRKHIFNYVSAHLYQTLNITSVILSLNWEIHRKWSSPSFLSFLVVVPGPVLSLSTQYIRDYEQIKVLVLCSGQNGKNTGGSLLTVLSLSVRDLAGTALMEEIITYCSQYQINFNVVMLTREWYGKWFWNMTKDCIGWWK